MRYSNIHSFLLVVTLIKNANSSYSRAISSDDMEHLSQYGCWCDFVKLEENRFEDFGNGVPMDRKRLYRATQIPVS